MSDRIEYRLTHTFGGDDHLIVFTDSFPPDLKGLSELDRRVAAVRFRYAAELLERYSAKEGSDEHRQSCDR